MKRCCSNCLYCRKITYSDRIKRHIADDFRLVKCWHDNSVHRKDKEQLKCKKFISKIDI